LSGFRWSVANRQLALLFVPLVAAVFVGWYLLPGTAAVILGAAVTLITSIYSLKKLCTLIPMEKFPGPVQKMLLFFRLAPTLTKG
jgi:enterobacterial common antigen flippase